jgi:hypothetical protein
MLRELLEREDWGVAAGALSFLAAVIWPFVCMAGPTAIVFTFAMISLFLALAGFSQRTTLFEAALPIPGRELVAARLLAMLAKFWFPAMVIVGETLVARGWKDTLPLLELAAVSTLLALAGQSLQIREARPLSRFAIFFIVLPVGVVVFVPQLLSHGEAIVGMCLAGTAVLIARLWVSVPDGFQIAPEKPTRARRLTLRLPSWSNIHVPVWWSVWRLLFRWRDLGSMVMLYPLFFLGLSLMVATFLIKPAQSACDRLEWLLILPVSRRRLLLMMLFPWLAVLIGFLWLNNYVRLDTKAPAVSAGYSDVWQEKKTAGSGTPNVLVPASFWRWAWGWKAPVIQAPWGEKTEPKTFVRLGFAFYNPYSVASDNSARFLEWQLSRATAAVYEGGGATVTRHIRTYGVETLAAALFYLGALFLGLRGRGKSWGWASAGGLFPLAAVFFLDLICTDYRVFKSGPLDEVIALRLSAILPQNPAALLALAALLLGSLYWAVEKQFEKVDLIPDLRPADGDQ